MQAWPDTRETLLARLTDPADRQAWEEFALIYEPLIYRVATRRGLQDADARDVTQRVLLTVSAAANGWKDGNTRGRFRGWLATVTTNAALNLLCRDVRQRAAGGSEALAILQRCPAADPEVTQLWHHERQLQLFRCAATRARPGFNDQTWQSFWRTAVDGQSADQAARELGKSVGAIYAARSRVMARIRREVESMERLEDTEHQALQSTDDLSDDARAQGEGHA